jgi:hypothetical protein
MEGIVNTVDVVKRYVIIGVAVGFFLKISY